MVQAAREGLLRLRPERRPFIISRSGYAGIQRHALLWTGDNSYPRGNILTHEHLPVAESRTLWRGLGGGSISAAFMETQPGNCLPAGWSLAFFSLSVAITRKNKRATRSRGYLANRMNIHLPRHAQATPAHFAVSVHALRGMSPHGSAYAAPVCSGPIQKIGRPTRWSDEFLCGDTLLVAPVTTSWRGVSPRLSSRGELVFTSRLERV